MAQESLINTMDHTTKRKYIQFSKIITLIFTLVFAMMCFVGMYLCYMTNDTQDLVNVVRAFGTFATVGFASYSVNSLGEKIVTKMTTNEEQTMG